VSEFRISYSLIVFSKVSCVDLSIFIFSEVTGTESSGGDSIQFLRVLRVLRAFRPLRVIARNENLKIVINTLFSSLPQLQTLLVLAGLFYLILGLFTTYYFKGTFHTCEDLPDGTGGDGSVY
jgi:hypothetical protein